MCAKKWYFQLSTPRLIEMNGKTMGVKGASYDRWIIGSMQLVLVRSALFRVIAPKG